MKLNFNQIILDHLSSRMRLEEIPLPENLKTKDSINKDKKLNVQLFKSEKIEKIVLTEIRTSESIINQNGLIYPADCYDFPVFDFMFNLFDQGLLAVSELYPLRQDKGYFEKYIYPMEQLHQKALKIPEPMSNPFEWIKEFSSEYGFFLGSTIEYLPEIKQIFKNYLDLWTEYVIQSEPASDPALQKLNSDYKKRFRKVFRENSSDFDNLYQNFGQEWTEKYYKEVIY